MMDGPNCAATIRALVNQTLPEESRPKTDDALSPGDWGMKITQWLERGRLRAEFLAVADELEGYA
jgi:hypothetical protein